MAATTLRGSLWLKSSGCSLKQKTAALSYSELVDLSYSDAELAELADFNTLEQDLSRTCFEMPTLSNLTKGVDDQLVQAKIERIVRALCCRCKQLGQPIVYTQGMTFLARFMLIVSPNELDAFWLMAVMLEDVLTPLFFAAEPMLLGFHADTAVLSELVARACPRLCAALGGEEELGGLVALLTCKWFICGFVDCLPVPVLLRLWDSLLVSSSDSGFALRSLGLFRFAVGIFLVVENDLLRLHAASAGKVLDPAAAFMHIISVTENMSSAQSETLMGHVCKHPCSSMDVIARRQRAFHDIRATFETEELHALTRSIQSLHNRSRLDGSMAQEALELLSVRSRSCADDADGVVHVQQRRSDGSGGGSLGGFSVGASSSDDDEWPRAKHMEEAFASPSSSPLPLTPAMACSPSVSPAGLPRSEEVEVASSYRRSLMCMLEKSIDIDSPHNASFGSSLQRFEQPRQRQPALSLLSANDGEEECASLRSFRAFEFPADRRLSTASSGPSSLEAPAHWVCDFCHTSNIPGNACCGECYSPREYESERNPSHTSSSAGSSACDYMDGGAREGLLRNWAETPSPNRTRRDGETPVREDETPCKSIVPAVASRRHVRSPGMIKRLFGRCMPCWSAEQARFEKGGRPDEGSHDEEGGCFAYKAHAETTFSPAPRQVRLVSLTDSNVNLIQSLLADESQDRLRDRSDYEKKMDCWKSPPRTGRSCDQFDREVASSFSNSVVHEFPQLAGPCDL